MAKRTDIKKILIIGSGPIVIGQAAEFDYAGTQACLALKEEGYEVVLCNSNPATIMTDTIIADKVYMEPLTLEYVAKIIRYERPDAIIPGIGGQTGLNLAMQLEKKGILKECHVQLLGTPSESIEQAEDRELFKELCQRLGEPVLPSQIANTMEEGLAAAENIGYPVVLRPAFTLGGTGGGFADNEEELLEIMKNALTYWNSNIIMILWNSKSEVITCLHEQDDQKQKTLNQTISKSGLMTKRRRSLMNIVKLTKSHEPKQYAEGYICFWYRNKNIGSRAGECLTE